MAVGGWGRAVTVNGRGLVRLDDLIVVFGILSVFGVFIFVILDFVVFLSAVVVDVVDVGGWDGGDAVGVDAADDVDCTASVASRRRIYRKC